MEPVYFDNSATTRVTERAARKAAEAMTGIWGNPSSVHGAGREAEALLDEARSRLLKALGPKNPRAFRLIFTGSGTEADNLAILGFLASVRRRPGEKKRIVTTNSEHPAVTMPFRYAETLGFESVYLPTKGGVVDPDELKASLTPDTVLLSVMRVNNETGTVYDTAGLFALAKSLCPGVVTHCDAVQGFGKIDCDPAGMKADLLTISGHKIGAPKGIGALCCREDLIAANRIRPRILGGGQEDGLRSGTENVPGAAAFGEAAAERSENRAADSARVAAVREAILSGLPDGVILNRTEGPFLPHILSVRVPGIKSEVLVRFLSAEGIFVSAGSACSSKKKKTSPALTAFGLTPDEADTTVRISLSPDNTTDEAERLNAALKRARDRLARIR